MCQEWKANWCYDKMVAQYYQTDHSAMMDQGSHRVAERPWNAARECDQGKEGLSGV